MHRLTVALLTIIALVPLSAPVVAAGPPDLPCTYHGTVRIREGSVPEDSIVRASIRGVPLDGVTVQQDPERGAVYVLSVRADDPQAPGLQGGRTGDIVTFRLEMPGQDDVPLLQTAVWGRGEVARVDLSSYVTAVLPLILRPGANP